MYKCVFVLAALFFPVFFAAGQSARETANRCAADTRLQKKLLADARFRSRYEADRKAFAASVQQRLRQKSLLRATPATYTIPVVFHIVLQNPSSVTDAQITRQLEQLNTCFAGENDQSALLAGFRDRIGTTGIAFCLAQRTPGNLPSTGIVRYTTTRASFDPDSDDMKLSNRGGADAWDPARYMNVWITNLQNGVLGFGSFPGVDESRFQGIVVAPATLPGSGNTQFNQGKTLVHETGHFFNLYHTWGDDDGACTGSDDVDDTPNQADATYGTRNGIQTDACSPAAPGFMYQNFMDYTDDADLLLFTAGQVTRLETALIASRLSLTTSNGCAPVNLPALDGELSYLVDYSKRVCTPSVSPRVYLYNRGLQTITSAVIRVRLGDTDRTFSFTGSIASLSGQVVSLPALTVTGGVSTLQLSLESVNNGTDSDPSNNQLSASLQYYPAAAIPLQQGFESGGFPPTAWDTLNPDNGIGWALYTGAGYASNTSVRMNNAEYNRVGQVDWLRMPQVNLSDMDSAFLRFQVAAAAYSSLSTPNNNWDTLEVMISLDCGASYTSLYKKWGSSLVTVPTPVTGSFVPTATQWRKDSVDLTPYIGQGDLLVAFRHATGYENNVYLDDISITPVIVAANLKAQGLLLYPNPTTALARLQFYPQPQKLKAIRLFDMRGALLRTWTIAAGTASNSYTIDLNAQAAGMYIIRAYFDDRVETRKIIKQ